MKHPRGNDSALASIGHNSKRRYIDVPEQAIVSSTGPVDPCSAGPDVFLPTFAEEQDKASPISPCVEIDCSGRRLFPWVYGLFSSDDECGHATGNRNVPSDEAEGSPWSEGDQRPRYIRAGTPEPEDVVRQPVTLGSKGDLATLFKRCRALSIAEEGILKPRKRKAQQPLSGGPEFKRQREDEDASDALKELIVSVDRYFQHKNADSQNEPDTPQSVTENAEQSSNECTQDDLDAVMLDPYPLESDLEDRYLSELPIVIVNNPPARPRRAHAPVVSSPLNPLRGEWQKGIDTYRAYMEAFSWKRGVVSAFRRDAFIPRQRSDCIYRICVPDGTPPDADPRQYPRCWACVHASQPLKIWQLKESFARSKFYDEFRRDLAPEGDDIPDAYKPSA